LNVAAFASTLAVSRIRRCCGSIAEDKPTLCHPIGVGCDMSDVCLQQKTWWPTTVLVAEHGNPAGFNDRLAAIILRKEREIKARETPQTIAGVSHGFTAYWTKYNVLNWSEPECAQLTTLFMDAINAFIGGVADPSDADYRIRGISCWANVLRQGESLDIHHHDPGFVSAHYIVKSGFIDTRVDGSESGNTVYYRPGFIERSQGDVFGGPWDSDWRISVPAVEGVLTLFPSYVRHEVKTYLGQSERITVALDVYVRKQNMPYHFAPPRWYVPRSASVNATVA
jgi:Putative 2OG-Fe(II) oxygenase